MQWWMPSVFEHLASHLFDLALGMHLHVPTCARVLGYLSGYFVRLPLGMLVRISPRASLFGYPLRKVFVRGLGIHTGPLQRHVLHHHFPCFRRLLCLFAYLARIIGRLHGYHGWRRLHGWHRLHGRHRVFPHAGQWSRLDVAPLDPPFDLFRPERSFVCPRCDHFPDVSIRPAHGIIYPAFGFPLPALLLAYAHVASRSISGWTEGSLASVPQGCPTTPTMEDDRHSQTNSVEGLAPKGRPPVVLVLPRAVA